MIDVEALRKNPALETTTESLGGVEAGLGGAGLEFGGPLGVHWGPVGASLGGGVDRPEAVPGVASGDETAKIPQKTHSGDNGKKPPSYLEERVIVPIFL